MHVCRIQEGYIWHPISITTLLKKTLQEPRKIGHQRNEYDWCGMNKIVRNKQCTVLWHVDHLKMSHAYSDIVSTVLSGIDAEYGNIVEMTITQVEIKKYLGIIINYSSTGNAIISMVGYIGNVLDDITEDMKRESVTPNPHNIFDITKYATKLS